MSFLGKLVSRRELEAIHNRNVRIALAFTALYGFSSGIWGSTILSGYLQDLPGNPNKKNFRVGLAEGMQGLVQVIAALPSGYFADKLSRQVVLRLGFTAGLLVILTFYVALTLGIFEDASATPNGTLEFILLCMGLSMAGVFDGITAGSLEAIYHDSVASNERSEMSTIKFITRVFFRACGPLISSLLLVCLGNDWSRQALRNTFFVGISLGLFPTFLLLLFRDDHCLGDESQAFSGNDYTRIDDEALNGNELIEDNDDRTEGHAGLNEDQGVLIEDPAFRRAKKFIPYIVLASDITFGIASGMTIKFFPLFFKEETGLSPASVNLIFVATPLGIVLMSILATRLTKIFGRVRVPLTFSFLGILLLYFMYYAGQINDKELWRNKFVILPVFILRTSLMNCSTPIRKSILIDFVDKEKRGMWNSIDSISQLSWSDSASTQITPQL